MQKRRKSKMKNEVFNKKTQKMAESLGTVHTHVVL